MLLTRLGGVSIEQERSPDVGIRKAAYGRCYLNGDTKGKLSARRWQGCPLGRGTVHTKAKEGD